MNKIINNYELNILLEFLFHIKYQDNYNIY